MGTKSKSLKERLAQKREDIKSKNRSFAYFAIKEGTTRFRPLPVGEENDWSMEATAFFLGKDLGLVISPRTFGEKCALMRAHEKLAASKDAKDRELAKRLKPTRKFFVPVIRYMDDKGTEIDRDNGAKLLMLTPGICDELLGLWLDEDEWGDFTNAKKGYDLKFSRTGKGKMDTEYSVKPCKPTELRSKQFASKIYNPEEMLREITPSYERTKELLDKFLNLPPEDEDTGGGERRKKNRNKERREKRKTDM